MYKSIKDLPETLRHYLPEDLQKIYLEGFQKSWEKYEEDRGGEMGREGVAHRDGMIAVQQEYVHDDETGRWYRKGEEPKKDEEAEEQSLLDDLTDQLEDL